MKASTDSITHIFSVLQIVLPPWPFYRTSPLKWQPAREFADSPTPAESPSHGKSTSGKEKKKK